MNPWSHKQVHTKYATHAAIHGEWNETLYAQSPPFFHAKGVACETDGYWPLDISVRQHVPSPHTIALDLHKNVRTYIHSWSLHLRILVCEHDHNT